MKNITPRTRTFIFAGVGLLALVLLAISINTLQLAPGHPVSFNQLAPSVTETGNTSNLSRFFMMIFRVFMILFWIILPILVIYLILDKDARKRFLRDLLFILPFIVLLLVLSNQQPVQKAAQNANPQGLNQPTLGAFAGTPAPPPPEFVPPPNWVTNLTTILIAVVITAIIIAIVYTFWRRAQNQKKLQEPLQKVEREAQAALDSIYAGGDLRETIMRCYLQMVEALKEYRGIYRNYDMTPHEFEVMLEKRGLPGEPVHQLTRLFEQVRYSTAHPGRQDETVAISSLSAIITACQKPRTS